MLLVAPIAEELLFRGWAYAFLERVYSTKWVIAITSIVFAAMHYDPVIGITSWIFLANAFFYVCMGIALGYIRYRTSSVTMCRSEEHTSELQSLMRISYAVFCLKKKKTSIYSA